MIKPLQSLGILLYFFFLALPAAAQPLLDSESRFHPIIGAKGMVVSQEMVASQVGASILAEGGNAIDAAVATGFALAVTLPQAGNLGGGGFMLIYLADENRTVAIDYREMAPSAATKDMFLNAQGEVDAGKARFSVQSSGVPGTVAGLVHVQEKYGNLSLKKVMAPAIKLARSGIRVTVALSESLSSHRRLLQSNTGAKQYFFKKDGADYAVGDVLKQRDLAASLKRISAQGAEGFYQGITAELFLAQMERTGGLITQADLDNYAVVERSPICGDYRDHRVCAMPPPSSGGIHLVQMLNILEGWDLKGLGHNSADYIHRLVESMRRAYADRSQYLGDADFFPVPVETLINKDYGRVLRDKIDLDHASRSADIGPGLKRTPESTETTHFSVWDDWGNVVSNTYTLNFSYGSGIAVMGSGFLLNNEMDDFSARPGSPNGFGLVGGVANSIEAGKRPLSSMTPTIVFDPQGKPLLVTGSPGGSTIITVVLQLILNVLEFDMGIAEASAASRIHHQWLPDDVYYESGISPDTLRRLREMGHLVSDGAAVLGSTQSIQSNGKGMLFGATDSRAHGAGVAIQP